MDTIQTQDNDLRTAPLPVDFYDHGESLVLIAALPGVREEDLDIQLEGNRLTLTAQRHEPVPAAEDDQTPTVLFREHGSVRWTRQFNLRTPIEADAIQATLEYGTLTLTLPKAQAALPRKITVSTA